MSKEKLPGNYIAGLVDGEGCFALKFTKETKRKRPWSPTYYGWKAEFAIVLSSNDEEILRKVKETIGVGIIHPSKRLTSRYSVQNVDEFFNVIIPFFRKFKLRAKKSLDFDLWTEAINIIYKNKVGNTATKGIKGFVKKEWNMQDLDKLITIRKEMVKIKAGRNNDFRYGNESLSNFKVI